MSTHLFPSELNRPAKIHPGSFASLASVLVALVFNLFLTSAAQAGSWIINSPLNFQRTELTAALLANGQVLVAGGWNGTNYTSSAELYDPASGTWTNTGALNVARGSHTATLLLNGQVLVAGGYQNDSPNYLSSVELYDPATGKWTVTNSMNAAHVFHAATLLPSGKVLIVGAGSLGGTFKTCELYDPTTGNWSFAGTMNRPRWYETATVLTNGTVLVAGGDEFNLPSAEVYNPLANTWTNTGAMTTNCLSHTATLLPNGQVLVAGGYTPSTNIGFLDPIPSAELYDPATGNWTATTNTLTFPRANHTANLLPGGKVLVAGGISGFAGTELYDYVVGAWTTNSPLNFARLGHAATSLSNGKVLIAGGSGRNGQIASTELYNPTTNATPTTITLGNSTALPGGAFQFSFTNTSDVPFTALATINLFAHMSNWTTLGGVTQVSSGHYQYTVPQTTNPARHFFGVRSQ